MAKAETADLVVVGAGMVGGWASWFAAGSGADRVVVLEKDLAGQGASSRAAGVVRAQGGTPTTVALGRFSIDFYRSQAGAARDRLRVPRARLPDPRGDAARRARRERARRDAARRPGSTCDGSTPPRRARSTRRSRTRDIAAGATARRTARSIRRGTCARTRSRCSRPAWSCASGRRSSVCGPRPRAAAADASPACETPDGVIATERVILTGGPSLRAVGALVGRADLRRRRAAPGGRHRAASGVRRRAPADGLRRRRRDLLAPGGGRAALGHVEPEGDARAGAGGRLAVPAADAAPPQHAGAGRRRTSASARRGAGRSTTRPTTCRSSGRSSPPTARRSTERRSHRREGTA